MPLRRIRSIPWILLFQAVMIARDRWTRLTPGERAHLAAMMRKSGGHPGRLTAHERGEVRRLAGKLDLPGVARDVAPLGRKWRGRR
jgi:hypothetical protein